MNLFYKIILLLQTEMTRPKPYGLFHIMCIVLSITSIILLYNKKKIYSEKKLKRVLLTYSLVALTLEILKQISWSFNYDTITNTAIWDFQWYAFPFQLCTTPIYVSLICAFLNNNNFRKSLLSYLSFITILGSIMTMILPDSCFTSDILVNIHTMFLHCGSFVVSVYLIMSKEVKINLNNLKNAFITFLVFILIAFVLNIVIYQSGILNEETFNMFYISPYFISSLPVFNTIQENFTYLIFLLTYIVAILLGAYIVYFISKLILKGVKN